MVQKFSDESNRLEINHIVLFDFFYWLIGTFNDVVLATKDYGDIKSQP